MACTREEKKGGRMCRSISLASRHSVAMARCSEQLPARVRSSRGTHRRIVIVIPASLAGGRARASDDRWSLRTLQQLAWGWLPPVLLRGGSASCGMQERRSRHACRATTAPAPARPVQLRRMHASLASLPLLVIIRLQASTTDRDDENRWSSSSSS
jgi:hypothetical protein